MNYSTMFAEPEANNYFSLIAWVLLNSIVNAVNNAMGIFYYNPLPIRSCASL